MAKFSPQTDFFKLSIKLKQIEDLIFYVVFTLSLVFTCIENETVGNYLSIVSLTILTILKFSIEHYQEKGESCRRKDLIDNSFGTKLSVSSSIDYYDNDKINTGLYKILVNVFENSYFSSQIASAMKKKVILKNTLLSLLILLFSIYGFKNSTVALPILQLFLSKYFIEDLIITLQYSSKIDSIFESITEIFSNGLSQQSINNKFIQAQIIHILIKYETNISHSKLFLDSNTFIKLNAILTENWSNIKNKYLIE